MMEQLLSSVARNQEIRFRFSLRVPNEDTIAVLKSDSGRGEAADRFLRFLTSPAPHKKKQPRTAP